MRVSRRTVAWSGVLVFVIALVVMMQQDDGQTPAAHRGDGARLSPGDTGGSVHDEPAGTPSNNPAANWAAMARELARDSSDARCVQVVKDITHFAESEQGAGDSRQDAEAGEEWLIAELDKLQRKASVARDPEILVAALLLRPQEDRVADDASDQTMLLELGTRAASSGSRLLAWHALRACAELGSSCPYAHLEQDLLDRQRDNAEAWALVATLRHQRRDAAGALAALQAAAGASTSTWHWPETIGLVERVVATHTALTFPDSAGAAFGAGAATAIPQQSGLLAMCRVESASSRAWGEACLAFTTLRLEHNEGEMAKAIALSIRREALSALGDTEGAAEAQEAKHRLDAGRMAGGLDLVAARGTLQTALINGSRRGFHAYLDSIRQSGETGGSRGFLRQELPPMLQRAGLPGREGARECMAGIFLEPRPAGDSRQARLDYRLQPGDELHITLTGPGRRTTLTRRVGADGRFSLPRGPSLTAADVTTEQFQRELAAAISGGGEPPEVLVVPIPRRSGEELRSAFEAARSEPQATAR